MAQPNLRQFSLPLAILSCRVWEKRRQIRDSLARWCMRREQTAKKVLQTDNDVKLRATKINFTMVQTKNRRKYISNSQDSLKPQIQKMI